MDLLLPRLLRRKKKLVRHEVDRRELLSSTILRHQALKVYHDGSYLNGLGQLINDERRTKEMPLMISPKGYTKIYDGYVDVLGKIYPFTEKIVEILDGGNGGFNFSVVRDEHNNLIYFRRDVTSVIAEAIPIHIDKMLAFDGDDDIMKIVSNRQIRQIEFNNGELVDNMLLYDGQVFTETWTDLSLSPGIFWGLTPEGDCFVDIAYNTFNISHETIDIEELLTIPNFQELKPKKMKFNDYFDSAIYLLTTDGYLYVIPRRGAKKYYFHLMEELLDRYIIDICFNTDDSQLNVISRHRTRKDPTPPPVISYKTPFGVLVEVA